MRGKDVRTEFLNLFNVNNRNWSIVFLIVFISFKATGQSPVYRHFTTNHGLESSTVYSCLQDDKGYLWFATESGVNRFNGRTFENFSVDEGLADSEIFRIFQDTQKRIWFLSYNGYLTFYKSGNFYNPSNTPFLLKAYCGQSILGIYEDAKGRLWINFTGTFVILIENEKVTKFDFKSDSLKSVGVNVIIRDDGTPEFRYAKSIFVFDEDSKQMKFLRNGVHHFFMQRPSRTETNETFQVIRNGILRFRNGEEKLIVSKSITDLPLYHTTIYNEKNGNVWIGTIESGIELYRKKNDSIEFIARLLPDIQVSDLVKDNEGNMWVCTRDDGVYMIPTFGSDMLVYSRSDAFPTRNIYSIYSDREGRTWTGGDRGFVTCIDSTGKIIYTIRLTQAGKNNSRVTDITQDSSSNIWVATNYSAYKIDKKGIPQEMLTNRPGFKGPRAIKSLTLDDQGYLYAAFTSGIVRYSSKSESFEILPKQGYPTRSFIVYYGLNRLFVANVNGLCEYKNDSLIPLYLYDQRLRNRIASLCAIDDSTLAIATSGYGVYLYRNDSIYNHISTSSGLPSNDCRQLKAINDNLCIVTDRGLANYYFKWNRLITSKISRAINGFYGNDVRDISVSGNKIFYATSSGLVVLSKYHKIEPSVLPRVSFLKLEVNEHHVTLDSVINLNYFENNLRISFEAITFTYPNQVRYEYRLANDYAIWNRTEVNEILLPKLPPGNYNLEVRAKLGNDNWGPVSSLKFQILEPFWQSVVFRILIMIVALACILLPFFLYYRKRMRDKKIELNKLQAVNKERQRISYDLHDDLGSSLTTIKMNAEIIRQKHTRKIDFNKELDDIVLYSRDANEKMSDIVWAISVANDHLPGLVAYINEFVTEFENKTQIPIEKTIDETLVRITIRPEVRKNIFLAVKEAFHNIQKHASASKVIFELFVTDNILNIRIKDDGKGIDHKSIQNSSMGLKSMTKRMNSISGHISIESSQKEGTEIHFRYNLNETFHKNGVN